MKLQTLAYQGSLSPPKLLRFGKHVVVQVAAPMNAFVPLSDPKNQRVLELLAAWRKVAPTIYVWDYTCNFENTVIPFGNYYAQALHIKEMVSLGIKGYYGEGCPHPGVDMIDLKTYVAARTAFDPSVRAACLLRNISRFRHSQAVPLRRQSY